MAAPGTGSGKKVKTVVNQESEKSAGQEKETTSTALATQGSAAQGSAALTTVPEIDLAADAQAFEDHYERGSIQIPFLQILQSNSPQVKPGESKFLKGAQMSMFHNTVTNAVFEAMEKGVHVVPCYHYATFIEWRLREKGGGFVKDWGLAAGAAYLPKTHKDEKGHDVLPNNETHLVNTEVYFLLLIHEDGFAEQVMCTMTSTQLKKARNWNSRMLKKTIDVPGKGKLKAPMFFESYRLKTITESNAKGSWYGYVITDECPTLAIGKDVYLAARAFREMMQKSVEAGAVNFSSAEGGDAHGDTEKEDIPF